MPRVSEIQRKGATRMARMLQSAGNIETMLAETDANRERRTEAAQDWTDQEAASFQAQQRIRDDFITWFDKMYKPRMPIESQPSDPWVDLTCDGTGVDELLHRFQGFLSFMLDKTPGRGEDQKVAADTFKRWSTNLVLVSLRQLQGWSDEGEGGISARLASWVNSTANLEGHRRFHKPTVAYGKFEASLCIGHILAHADSPPLRFAAELQKVSIIQWCLNTGERPGDCTLRERSGYQDFIKLRDVVIRRDLSSSSTWSWYVEVSLHSFKGNRGATKVAHSQVATCEATKFSQNLQFEMATTLIPLLIWRKRLVSYDALGNATLISSVTDFLQSKQCIFRGLGDDPLFLAMTGGGGSFKGAGLELGRPLTTNGLVRALRNCYTAVGLPGSGAYHFRFEKGDKIRILFGPQAQAEALHHRPEGRVGYLHYSSGLQNLPVSRVMLEETDDERKKLEQAGYYRRKLSSHAMISVIRTLAAQKAGVKLVQPQVDAAELHEVFKADDEMQRLAREIARADEQVLQAEASYVANPTLASQEVVARTKRVAQSLRRASTARKSHLSSGIRQKAEADYRRRLGEMAAFSGGTVEGIRTAHSFLLSHDAIEAEKKRTNTNAHRQLDSTDVGCSRITAPTTQQRAVDIESDSQTSEADEADSSSIDASECDDSDCSVSDGEVEAGKIDADDEVVDPDVERANLSRNVELSRAALMLHYEGRLNAAAQVELLQAVWLERGFCPLCSLVPLSTPANPGGGLHWTHADDGSWIVDTNLKRVGKKILLHFRTYHADEWSALCMGQPPALLNTEISPDSLQNLDLPELDPDELAQANILAPEVAEESARLIASVLDEFAPSTTSSGHLAYD
ncbi:hypothetical protein sr11941 [Sporisorium reilianum SRZ2]|uniref:Uncharacterized protein n=1 Tax=Sporisorium reilianum (strain SRZ2) TaxID=999809 RepID=E6ZL72_SPORE|nr:hypothetical protein sr11941 [Sporisorium reilianum SRZ2]